MKAARALHSLDHPDLATCLEIVKKTNNKKIIAQVEANLYTTGVVSGEYGIAEAYEGKAKALEPYLNDSNARLKAFAKRMVVSFRKSAIGERKRADEEKGRRLIEFEGI